MSREWYSLKFVFLLLSSLIVLYINCMINVSIQRDKLASISSKCHYIVRKDLFYSQK